MNDLQTTPTRHDLSANIERTPDDYVRLWANGLAKGTREVYRTIIGEYQRSMGMPPTPDNVITFIENKCSGGKANGQKISAAYMLVVGSCLRSLMDMMEIPITAGQRRSITYAIKGASNDGLLKGSSQKDGIGRDELLQMIALSSDISGEYQQWVTVRNRLLIGLCWMGAYRISEVCALTNDRLLVVDDVTLRVEVDDFKGRKVTDGNRVKHIKSTQLVTWVKQLYTDTEPKDGWYTGHPVFFDFRKKHPSPMTYRLAHTVVTSYAERIGVTSKIGTHSLRIGAINAMRDDWGMSRSDVGKFTGQTDDIVARYERFAEENTSPLSIDNSD